MAPRRQFAVAPSARTAPTSRRSAVRQERLAVAIPPTETNPPPAVAAAAAAADADRPPTPWGKSRAKQVLQDDILSGEVNKFRGPTGIYKSRTIYQKYKFTNFSNNYYTLRKTLGARVKAAAAAKHAFENDAPVLQARRNRIGTFHYNGSDIQKQLRSDVRHGRTRGLTPSQVYWSRRVYWKDNRLPLEKFSNHLWHERRRHERGLHSEAYHDRMQFVTAPINVDDNNKTDEEED